MDKRRGSRKVWRKRCAWTINCARIMGPYFRFNGKSSPPKLTPDVEWILGRPNFWCAPIAHRLVKLGIAKIETHAGEEQAYVLHWLLGLHEKYGAAFRDEADKILKGDAVPQRGPDHE